MNPSIRLSIDIGGTFTDVEFVDEASGRTGTFKAPTTKADPSIGLMAAVKGIADRFGFSLADVSRLVHGTTIATNAVLTRELPTAALVTTAGFEDVLAIGRHARADVYRLEPPEAAVLVPRRRRFGVAERIGADGRVIQDLNPEEIARIVGAVMACGAAVVAICLLNSFVSPSHEKALKAAFAAAGMIDVSCSHEISPEIREFERTSTTVLNALLIPVVRDYLEKLEARRGREGLTAPLYLVQSNGGVATAAAAMQAPARLLLSGPAGGALAAERLAGELGLADVVAVDMGGTSYDVSLIQGGRRAIVSDGEVGGCPVRLPMVEMRTIGAGGGSIVRLDGGGRLQVGPASAGADPGPACYGRGGSEPTVTDVNVVLGRLDPATLGASGVQVDAALALEALRHKVSDRLGMDVEELAEGVLALVVAKFAGAIRLSLFERGLDPTAFALMSFGGAGGLHAAETAEELGISTVVFPRGPSTFSAHGILRSDIVHDLASSGFMALDEGRLPQIGEAAMALQRDAWSLLEEDGIPPEWRRVELGADLRYRGQAFELAVALPSGEVERGWMSRLAESFHEQHFQRFSFSDPDDGIEVVTMRATATGRLPHAAPSIGRSEVSERQAGTRQVRYQGSRMSMPVVDAASIGSVPLRGPAIVEQRYTSLFLPPAWTLAATPSGDLVAKRDAS